jgi:hypothetical protein
LKTALAETKLRGTAAGFAIIWKRVDEATVTFVRLVMIDYISA